MYLRCIMTSGPLSLPPYASQPPWGEQLGLIMSFCHDVLPHHRPRHKGRAGENGLKTPNFSQNIFPLLDFSHVFYPGDEKLTNTTTNLSDVMTHPRWVSRSSLLESVDLLLSPVSVLRAWELQFSYLYNVDNFGWPHRVIVRLSWDIVCGVSLVSIKKCCCFHQSCTDLSSDWFPSVPFCTAFK